ncbi:MAG: GerW family sporulation protein [Oscillospiraceae bacterium]|jgi:uncharacterized spore protein YtfJ|nr:GerW family sporulation protein [Oscillospiraceae bacterium]
MNNIMRVFEFTAAQAQQLASAQSVAGAPIVIGEVTVIPMSKVSCGFAGGGSNRVGAKKDDRLSAGSGAKVKLTPVAFLAVCGKDVTMLYADAEDVQKSGVFDALKPLVEKFLAGRKE